MKSDWLKFQPINSLAAKSRPTLPLFCEVESIIGRIFTYGRVLDPVSNARNEISDQHPDRREKSHEISGLVLPPVSLTAITADGQQLHSAVRTLTLLFFP